MNLKTSQITKTYIEKPKQTKLATKVEVFGYHKDKCEWILTLLDETCIWAKSKWIFQERFCSCSKSKLTDVCKNKEREARTRSKRSEIFHKGTKQSCSSLWFHSLDWREFVCFGESNSWAKKCFEWQSSIPIETRKKRFVKTN